MKTCCYKKKKNLFSKMKNLKGLWFHIAGIVCIAWFLVRVLPKPDRIQYPCQQMSIGIALGYIAFWSLMFHGLGLWLRKARFKTTAVLPAILVTFVFIFSITGMVFADIYYDETNPADDWDPIPKDPIGTPQGVNPGRVVWTWNPNATRADLIGYWWMDVNNNQAVIDKMFSVGIQGLAGVDDDSTAWDVLFKYFNQAQGHGDVGYQPGEKIAIKINLNNCWVTNKNPYIRADNDRDASPHAVKALLRQLVDIAGVAQEDITVYDASRWISNWFYKRVCYETYPAIPLVPEFPDVNYVDSDGGAPGRQKLVASTEKIYFADGTGYNTTLPTCVTDAKYIINMPILKKHPNKNGVTLSAKNLFGTWIEPVWDVHDYHEAGFTLGNPAPQVDLLAHKHIGGKTLLFIGDGLFGTPIGHREIGKFQMYPFNNDWTNSFFFSQDPVAIDSVMYGFLHEEDPSPCEGSQNYLHQAAEPLSDTYDPEQDGTYLSESLGVHEHWNTTFNIFSPERYSGTAGNGIDFVTYDEDDTKSRVFISNPIENYLYKNGYKLKSLPITVVIGKIDVESKINEAYKDVEKVEFYVDGQLMFTDHEEPYIWTWGRLPLFNSPLKRFFRHTLETVAYYGDGNTLRDSMIVWKIF